MKKIALFILFFLPCYLLYGQKRFQIKSKYNLPELVINRCNCPARVISTDSVYSFLNSINIGSPFYPSLDRNIIFDSNPVSFEKITGNYRMEFYTGKGPDDLYPFFDDLVNIGSVKRLDENHPIALSNKDYYEYTVVLSNKDYNQSYKDIDLEAFTEVFAALWDSTTTYSQPVREWDRTRLPQDWFNMQQYHRLYNLFSEKAKGISVNLTKTFTAVETTRPVFDKNYNYALVVLIYGQDEIRPLLFKRESTGWRNIQQKE